MNDKSDVFFCDLHAKPGNNLLDKLERLVMRAGMGKIDFKKRLVAVKLHFGEPGNLAFIRPNYAATLVHIIKELGGTSFLTDTNTLYSGRRANAPDHLLAAQENGFTPCVTGCQIIIADGLRGNDFQEVSIPGELCQTAKIGSAIAHADVLISLSHFKGHEMTGFGGTLKNLGMGGGSVGGKLEMHSTSKPQIHLDNCTGCGQCIKTCAHDAIQLNMDRKAVIDDEHCVGCGQCIATCQFNAAQVVWEQASENAGKKIAEYAMAAMHNKPAFHISFVVSVSPDCDCWGMNDYPIVPDIGILASFDPVAIDQAAVDLVTAAPALPQSRINTTASGCDQHMGTDKFKLTHPDTHWQTTLDHAQKLGLGVRDYQLVTVE